MPELPTGDSAGQPPPAGASIADLLAPLLITDVDPVAAGWQLRALADAVGHDGAALIAELVDAADSFASADRAVGAAVLRIVHNATLGGGTEAIANLNTDSIATLCDVMGEAMPNRFLMLHLLALRRDARSLGELVTRLVADPPDNWIESAQVISPLMQRDDWPIEAVFPAAIASLQHASLAAPILDLANHLVRQERVPDHPLTGNLAILQRLLGEVSGRLARFEADPAEFGTEVDVVQRRLGEAVALAVSLCDTLGLIGDESSIGKLNQAVELRHRRVQCEAAGALARLAAENGRVRLVELAAEPAARLRAIHYADELGFGDQIDPKYRGEDATAEAELALWLSQPQQMGVPPTGVEVVATRRMLWPSFENPVDVQLVRFEYNFGDRRYSNVGVTGPVTFAFSTDVADLPVDDIFAVYAGWHAEHPEIFSLASAQWNESQLRLMKKFQDELERDGYESISPLLLGVFLDETAGVFNARRGTTELLVVTDGLETIDQATGGRLRPFTPEDLFNLYKGRKMLRTFN